MERKSVLILMASLILSGCLSRRSEVIRYYTIEFPENIKADFTGITELKDKTCLLLPVEISPAFSTHQIALRENTHEIRYFNFNQWAVRPEHGLTAILTEFFNYYEVFAAVYNPSLVHETDYTLTTTVYSLEVLKERKDYSARLSVGYIITDNHMNLQLHSHRADRKIILRERDLNLFSAAVSEMFAEELAFFLQSLAVNLNNM